MNRMHIKFIIQTQIETLYPYEPRMMKPIANCLIKCTVGIRKSNSKSDFDQSRLYACTEMNSLCEIKIL
jgi:hypothetical protein